MLDEPLGWHWYLAIGVGYFGVSLALGEAGLATLPIRAGLAAVAFAALGVLCLANWSTCGSLHCIVSGPPYLALGAGAGLVAVGVLDVAIGRLWLVFVVVMLAAFALEHVVEHRRGDMPAG